MVQLSKVLNDLPLCKNPVRNQPGMFDIIKGWGILAILLEHTILVYSKDLLLSGGNYQIKSFIYNLMDNWLSLGFILMPLFFIISGYGFKAIAPVRCLKKQFSYLLKPYLIVGAAGIILCFLIHLFFLRSLKSAAIDSLGVFLSFLLGWPDMKEFHQTFLPGLYSMWFILSLFIAWNLLNIIIKHIPSRFHFLACTLSALCGLLWARKIPNLYCIAPSLVAVFFLYCGSQIKKYNLLNKRLHPLFYILVIAVYGFQNIYSEVSMYSSQWKNGIFDIISTVFGAFVVMQLFIRINKYNKFLLDGLRHLGRYSLWLICIHTTEYLCIPWDYFVGRISSHITLDFIVIFCVRVVLNLTILKLIIYINKKTARH